MTGTAHMSSDVTRAAGEPRRGHLPLDTADDYARQMATYRGFIRGVALVGAHALLVLALLADFTM